MPNRDLILPLILLLAAVPAAAQPAPAPAPDRLSAEQHLALRCAATFAVAASDQARGIAGSSQWPVPGPRGREYFVRTMARLMDETGMTREQVRDAALADVAALRADTLKQANPAKALGERIAACIPLRDALVPPADAGRTP